MKCFLRSTLLVLGLTIVNAGSADNRFSDKSDNMEDFGLANNLNTTLADLDSDCLLHIFKHMSVHDLNPLVTMNKYIWSIVRDEISWRFATKQVFINVIEDEYYAYKMLEGDTIIEFNYASVVAPMLEQFGESIRNLKLRIGYQAKSDKVQTVYELIRKHCTDSLEQLHVSDLQYSFMGNVTKPFKNVKSVTFTELIIDVDSKQLNFREMFPSLRRLKLRHNFNVIDISKLDFEFPHLEHLSMDCGAKDGEKDDKLESLAQNLIMKNPKIRTLKLGKATPSLLKLVVEQLPNITHLEFDDFNNEEDIFNHVHFEHVKIYRIISSGKFGQRELWPTGITFGKDLEEFDMQVPPLDDGYTNIITNFLERYKNLKKLRIKYSFSSIIGEQLISRIIAANSKLTELVLDYVNHVEDKIIVELIENSKELQKFELKYVSEYDARDVTSKLHGYFDNQWIIYNTYTNVIGIKK